MSFFVFSIFLFVTSHAGPKEIALTFDDSPRFLSGYLDGPTRAKKLIHNLKKAKVSKVAFFSVSSNIDSEGHQRLQAYADAGHLITNHTHTHPNFNDTTAADYIQDFLNADKQLSKYKNFEKWFRFPFLREGNEPEKVNAMRLALTKAGYQNSYITINNYDWYMETQFQQALKNNKNLNLDKFRSYYVNTLMKAVEYYDEMAQKHLGRSPKHVLLLHETDTNALFIADLVAALELKGWKIISPREAYKDDISKYVTQTVFKYNPGRIGEIARDKGQTQGLWHETCDEAFLDQLFKKQVLN